MSAARIAVLSILVTCVALLAVFGYQLAKPMPATSIGQGAKINDQGSAGTVSHELAPDFTLTTLDGRTMKLSQLRGKTVVINFWSSWCPPCKDEAPVLQRAWERYKGQNVVLLGVDLWEDKSSDARDFVLNNDLTYPIGTPKERAAVEYGLTGIPETFVVDPSGMIVAHWIGPLTDEQVTTLIEGGIPRP